jgi:hypothetical protein
MQIEELVIIPQNIRKKFVSQKVQLGAIRISAIWTQISTMVKQIH